ncbi:hypothetical protein [Acrocarpospora sp. B8E8]|uniref:hypothetical protein n=1 Tax=Acrocarpospora sp. B8E8 TaxID=3153572 RepID=UPI00325D8F1A
MKDFGAALKAKAAAELGELHDLTVDITPGQLKGFTRQWAERVSAELSARGVAIQIPVAPASGDDFLADLQRRFASFDVATAREIDRGISARLNDARKALDELRLSLANGSRDLRDSDLAGELAVIRSVIRELSSDTTAMSAAQTRAWRILAGDARNVAGQISTAHRGAARDTERAYKDAWARITADITARMRQVETTVKTGLRSANDASITASMRDIESRVRSLTANIAAYDHAQQGHITSLVRQFRTLSSSVERETSRSRRSTESLRAEFARLARDINAASDGGLAALAKFERGVYSVERAVRVGLKEASQRGLTEAASIIGKFADDNGIVSGASRMGSRAGLALGQAFATTVRYSLARGGYLALVAFVALGTTLGPVISAVSQLAGGFTALASSAVYAAGSLAALSAVLAAVVQGAGVLQAAWFGVEDALSAVMAANDQSASGFGGSATAARAAARAIKRAQEDLADAVAAVREQIADSLEDHAELGEEVAERIAEAQERLAEVTADVAARIADQRADLADALEAGAERVADAEESLADTRASAARSVESAERSYANAIINTAEAQQALNQARVQAKERLEDLALAVQGSALNEEDAQLAVIRAKQALEEELAKQYAPDATAEEQARHGLDAQEADLAYRQALQRLAEIQEANADLQQEYDEATTAGVEGSRDVLDAQQALVEAAQAQADAQRALAEAQEEALDRIGDAERDLARARRDGARQVADAEKDIAEARRDGARQIADAEDALADARVDGADRLADSEERLAEIRADGAERIADAEERLAEARQAASEAVGGSATAANAAALALSKLSPAAREFVLYLANRMFPRLEQLQWRIQEAIYPPLLAGLRKSEGLLDRFDDKIVTSAGLFGGFTEAFFDWLNTPDTEDKIGKILDSNNRIFATLLQTALLLADPLLDLAVAAGPFVEDVALLARDFAAWINKVVSSEEGRAMLADFFDRVWQTVKSLAGILGPLGLALITIFQTAQPYGQKLLEFIERGAKKFLDWVTSAEGNQALQVWFAKGEQVMEEVLRLVAAIVTWFFSLTGEVDFAAFLAKITDDVLPALQRFFDSVSGLEGVWTALGAAILIVIDVVSFAFNALGVFFGSGGQGIISSFLGLIGDLVSFFDEDLGRSIRETGLEWDGLAAKTENTEKTLADLKDSAKSSFSGFSSSARTAFADLDSTIKSGTSNTGGVLNSWLGTYFGTSGSISKSVGVLAADASTKFDSIQLAGTKSFGVLAKDSDTSTKGVAASFKTNLAPVSVAVSDEMTASTKVIKDSSGQWRELGQDLADGFVAGVRAGGIPGALRRIVDEAIRAMKDELEIASPSKRTQALGLFTGQGFAHGIDLTAGMVSDSAVGIADSVTSAWSTLSADLNMSSVNADALASVGTERSNAPASVTRIYDVDVTAAPTIPTERQITAALKRADALYN